MKKFTSILATALIAAPLFLSSPFPASGDNSLTKIIHFQKTDPSTRSISDADLPEASIRNDELSVSFVGMVSPKKNRVEIADSVFVVMMTPDQQYNFQSWKSGSSAYTPLFIDLIDNYNQRTYYSLKYKGSNVKLSYPDDKVSGFPISDLENLVYASTSISGFRQKLENYIVEHPSIGNGMTEENLEILFESYE